MHFDYAVYLVLGKIGQRDIAALEKGKSRVVVLKVACGAHSGRVLVYKAENARIAAGMLFVHQRTAEFKTGVVLFLLADPEDHALSAAHDLKLQAALVNAEAVVKHVANLVSVYCHKLISGKQPHLFGCRACADTCYNDHSYRLPSCIIS